MTGLQIRTLVLSALGGMLEYYDFIIFVFFAKVISGYFFPATMPEWLRETETFGLFGAGYLVRPVGGLIMAHFGDTRGRKKVFTFSVLLMAVPTLLIGLLPGYATIGPLAPLLLLLMRMLQGASIGGEAPGGWVFVTEHAGQGRTGLACGLLTGGLTAGIPIGTLVALWLNETFSAADIAQWAWRLPFLLGGVFGLTAMILRQWLEETPVFKEMHAQAALSKKLPLRDVLGRYRREVVCSLFATGALTSFGIVGLLMMPALMQSMHGVAPAVALQSGLVESVVYTTSIVLFSLATDRWSMRRIAPIAALCGIIGIWVFYGAGGAYPGWLVPLGLLGGLGGCMTGLIPISMVKAFPAALRFSGVSLSYNVAYAVCGGLAPLFVSALARYSTLAPACFVTVALLCGLAALLLNPDMTGSDRQERRMK